MAPPNSISPAGAASDNDPGFMITDYSTNLAPACLIKKGNDTCSESISYSIKYAAKPRVNGLKGTLIIKNNKVTITASAAQQKDIRNLLTDSIKTQILNQFRPLASFVTTWKKTITDKPESAANGALLDPNTIERPINFIILGATSGIRAREIGLELMAFDEGAVLAILDHLKEEAQKEAGPERQGQKAADPEYQAQKSRIERIESLTTQVSVGAIATKIFTKETKNVNGSLVLLAHAFVATTVTDSSPDSKTTPINFLKSKLEDFAKENSKGVTVMSGTPPKETIMNPYEFLRNRLLELKAESVYLNKQASPGRLMDESIAFLTTALNDNRVYVHLSPEEALKASLIDNIKPDQIIAAVANELNAPYSQDIKADWENGKWLKSSSMSPQENYKKIAGNLISVDVIKLEGGKAIINPNEMNKLLKFVAMIDQTSKITAEQKNTYLAALGIVRVLFGNESNLKKTIKVWDSNAKASKDFPLQVQTGAEQAYLTTIGEWKKVIATPVATTPAGKAVPPLQAQNEPPPAPGKQQTPVLTGPPSPNQTPIGRLPLIPTPGEPVLTLPSKWAIAAPYIVGGSIAILGIGLLTGGLNSGNIANQGDFGLGDKGMTVAGSVFTSAGSNCILGAAIYALSRKSGTPFNVNKQGAACGIGAGAGAPLGLAGLSRYGSNSATGGGNTVRNPADSATTGGNTTVGGEYGP